VSALRLLGVILLLTLVGCANWQHAPLAIPDALNIVQTQRIGDVEVSAAILDPEQAKAQFGIDLDDRDIQAIWLRVSNHTDKQLWFIRTVLDMDVYSADEVALMFESAFGDEDFSKLRQHLRDQSMHVQVPALTMTQGFVFVPKAYGGRYVDVRLVQDLYEVELARKNSLASGKAAEEALDLEMRFEYTIPLPDGMFDFEGLSAARIYARSRPPLNTPDDLRQAVADLPCCSRNADGDMNGDPLNLVVVGSGANIMHSLARAGWSFTHRISLESVTRLVGASLSKQPYPVAPVSDLFLFDRKQDFALQRPRPNISQRNHLRLWLAPFSYRGDDVWVGQISRDIGVKLTSKSSTLTTHIIDPDVDLAREYLLHSLFAGGFVDAFGFVSGAPVANMDAPVENLVGDPYFSDGKRLVVILSPQPKSYGDVKSLLWERSGAAIAEEQSPAADRNTRRLKDITDE
jgi:hypothetical protein